MKHLLDSKDENEFEQRADELRVLARVPTSQPDITAHYRTRTQEWGRMETWQREELLEFYEGWLSQLAIDSAAYCRVKLSVDELRNLSSEDLDNFNWYVTVQVPSTVIEERGKRMGLTEADINKGVAKLRRILSETLERYRTLDKIGKLGQ